jgi:sugar-specific transcriptional regulator TrmB
MDLTKLGITPAEELIVNQLVINSALSVTELVKFTKISASNVYIAVEKLIEKGLVSKTIINLRPVYRLNGAESINSLVEKIENDFNEKQNVLAEFKKKLKSSNANSLTVSNHNAEIFIGISNLRTAHKRLFEEKVSGEFIFFYSYDELIGKTVHDFFAKMDVNDYYKNISTRGLFSKNYQKLFVKRKQAKFKSKFTDLPIPSSVNVYGDKVLIISWDVEPTGFLLTSKDIASNFKKLFDEVWNRTN